jgi:hypothetical protein
MLELISSAETSAVLRDKSRNITKYGILQDISFIKPFASAVKQNIISITKGLSANICTPDVEVTNITILYLLEWDCQLCEPLRQLISHGGKKENFFLKFFHGLIFFC